jgi:hypothetical protein
VPLTSPTDLYRSFERATEPPSTLAGATFLLARVAQNASLDAVGQAFRVLSNGMRLSIIMDRRSLADVDDAVGSWNGGLVLDFDLDTPLSAMLHPRLEAVYFRPMSDAYASDGLRWRCAMVAAIALARDLGLAAMGESPAKDLCCPPLDFDYVPHAEASSDTRPSGIPFAASSALATHRVN